MKASVNPTAVVMKEYDSSSIQPSQNPTFSSPSMGEISLSNIGEVVQSIAQQLIEDI